MNKTKIVCTIGPATWDTEVLKDLISNGMRVARINASFADGPEIERVTTLIRSVSNEVAVLLDLMGHKIRINDIGDTPIEVKAGEKIILSTDPNYDGIVVSYENLHLDISTGERILIDDGKVRLRVLEIRGKEIECEVENNSLIKRKKTVNVPGVHLSFEPLTEKDKSDIQSGLKADVDFIAGSFIRDEEDVKAIRSWIPNGNDTKIIAKIEDPIGVMHFDEILRSVDGIMVARGDLGVEVEYAKVPVLQKEFIKKCNEVGKPVIVATHMLESMTESPAPTRAEVSDVANAIYDGADAVMLSAETSTGKYPKDAVRVIKNVSEEIESRVQLANYSFDEGNVLFYNNRAEDDLFLRSAIAITKAQLPLSMSLEIKSILVLTKRGFSARLLSRLKLPQTIYAFVSSEKLARQLNLSRGVKAVYIKDLDINSREQAIARLIQEAKDRGIVETGDLVSLVIGSQVFGQNSASILELEKIS